MLINAEHVLSFAFKSQFLIIDLQENYIKTRKKQEGMDQSDQSSDHLLGDSYAHSIQQASLITKTQRTNKPDWLKVKLPTTQQYSELKQMLRKGNLHTVCEEASCPNIYECFSKGVATFMILGDTCTRYCHYCHVKTGRGKPIDPDEPRRVAESIKELGLQYVVITSVTRDDLPLMGSDSFAQCVEELRRIKPDCKVELLIPDFQFKEEHLQRVIDAQPDVISHNIEAVERVYKKVRIRGDYPKSLQLIQNIKKLDKTRSVKSKSGMMLGLGETKEEILQTLRDLREHDCNFLTLGQYLQPTPHHAKVERFVTPQEFKEFQEIAMTMGFEHVEAGPLVRSSYRADKLAGKIGERLK